MSKQWFRAMVIIGALMMVLPVLADHGQGKGKAKGNPHNNQGVEDRDEDRADHRWERRGDYEYRTYGDREGMPPGGSKGKKTGWGNCGMPPGQAKKYGCQSYRYQGREYYYYRDDVGRIIVRRPTIHIHGGIDVH